MSLAYKLDIIRLSKLTHQNRHLLKNQNRHYFTALPDITTIGVMGDECTYSHTVAVRAVTSSDAMTADWARIPYDMLERISNRIVYYITSKPPATIEWE